MVFKSATKSLKSWVSFSLDLALMCVLKSPKDLSISVNIMGDKNPYNASGYFITHWNSQNAKNIKNGKNSKKVQTASLDSP